MEISDEVKEIESIVRYNHLTMLSLVPPTEMTIWGTRLFLRPCPLFVSQYFLYKLAEILSETGTTEKEWEVETDPTLLLYRDLVFILSSKNIDYQNVGIVAIKEGTEKIRRHCDILTPEESKEKHGKAGEAKWAPFIQSTGWTLQEIGKLSITQLQALFGKKKSQNQNLMDAKAKWIVYEAQRQAKERAEKNEQSTENTGT